MSTSNHLRLFAMAACVLMACSSGDAGLSGAFGGEVAAPTDDVSNGFGDVGLVTPDTGSISLDVESDTLEPGALGYPCSGNEDCFSGYCIPGPDGSICTKTCEDDCPAGWSCNSVNGGGDVTYICVPDYLNLCRPCHTSADCAESLPFLGSCT